MVQNEDSPSQQQPTVGNSSHSLPSNPIAHFKSQERIRWKKAILSCLFIAAMFSILIHITIGLVLNYSLASGYDSGSSIDTIEVKFAVEQSEELTQMPEGQELKQQESIPTKAVAQAMQNTQASFSAETATSALDVTSHMSTPSLAGGAGAGMSTGIGGSGGATSFFGITSSGTRFCYIVDVSGSMNQQHRLEDAIGELAESLKRLPDYARFYILFYSSRITEPKSQVGWNIARSSTIRRITKEFRELQAGGGTNPRPAFEMAFALNPLPDVIFFLTDGEISGFSVATLREMLPKGARVIVNTIAFGSSSSQLKLIEIAKATGGQYKFVPSGGVP